MRAQILSIGDEILGGFITDSNSTWLEQQLALLNIEVVLVTHVGDNRDRIADVIEHALADTSLVICTGGVGPTEDDLTREAIAQVVGEEPEVDPGLLEEIRGFFAARGLEMPERNAKQAWLIPSCEPLPNAVGTAPGWLVRNGGKIIVAMPGVPREMFRMWTDQALPRIAEIRSGNVIRSTTLKTIGIGESLAETYLHPLIVRADPIVATYAKDDGVHIRVTAIASTAEEAEGKRDACLDEIFDQIGLYIYGRDEQTLPGVLINSLHGLGLRIAISDVGAGGRFASLLAAFPDAEGVLAGSDMSPSNRDTSANDLAQTAASAYQVELGVGITMTSESTGPGVHTGEIVVAVAGVRQAERAFPIRSAFEDMQRRSALFAAEVVRSALISD
jgi:nicotinamide-nucleotide amidase